jgi:hypothetical protein
MPELRNSRHEKFAQAVARGASLADAYAEAGYRRFRSSASRLLSYADVAARVEELKRETAERNKVTLDTLLAEFAENRKVALGLGQPAAANSATIGKARLLGLLNAKEPPRDQQEEAVITFLRDISKAGSRLPLAPCGPKGKGAPHD